MRAFVYWFFILFASLHALPAWDYLLRGDYYTAQILSFAALMYLAVAGLHSRRRPNPQSEIRDPQ
jgi:hypothetical protein